MATQKVAPLMGPTLVFDKSTLHGLNDAELFELCAWFTPACTPTLISEILADLKTTRADRLPEETVRALAGKMQSARGAEPASVRGMIVSELHGNRVPMGPSIPVVPGTRGVRKSADGTGLMVSLVEQQRMWARLAAGEFTSEEQDEAARWRESMEAIDLRARCAEWVPVLKCLGQPSTIAGIISGLDKYFRTPDLAIQKDVMERIFTTFDVPALERETCRAAIDLVAASGYITPVYLSFPYAASALRVFGTYACMVSRGLHTPRYSDHIDLDYLCYAPFSAVFASDDRLHRKLFPAAVTTATFCPAKELKRGLARLATARATMTVEDWRAHHLVHGSHPPPADGCVVAQAWRNHAGPPYPFDTATMAQTIDDLDPETRDLIRRMTAEFSSTDQ